MTLLKGDPTEVGGYRLEGRLGAGGMGVVYAARSPGGHSVALKVIRRQWAEDPEFRARFELEVAAARMVHSRFTAPVVDADPHAPEPWMASLHLGGESLDARVGRQGPLESGELRRLAAALAGALRDIHRAGVVHRDLKPGNVLLTGDGPRVIDFGIARALDGHPLTETGRVVGTPAVMAPEQLLSCAEIGPEADVFSLGSVLAYAAMGRYPFEADGPYASAYRVVHEEPDLADVPDEFRRLVADCLAKDPGGRPTPEEILASLSIASPPLRTAPGAAVVRGLVAAVLRWSARPVPGWVAAVAVLALLVAGGAVVAVGGRPEFPAPAGWRPWETRIREVAAPGEACLAGPDAIYCEAGSRTVMRVDTTDGTVSWRHTIPAREVAAELFQNHPTGPEATVELLGAANGRLWYAHRDTAYRRLRVLDIRTGKSLWTRTFTERPLEIRLTESMYFLVYNRRVEAFDVTTHAIRWTRHFRHLTYLIANGHGVYLADVGRPRTTVTAVEEDTGARRWSTTVDGPLHYQVSAPGALYFRTPLGGDGGGALVRLDTRSRKAATVLPPVAATRDNLAHQAVAHSDVVCIAHHNGTVIAVDHKTGTMRWRTSVGVRISAPPTLAGGRIYLAAADGRVIALDTQRGKQVWDHQPRQTEQAHGSWARSPVMSINDNLYAVSPQGSVYTVR
ncbi:serine/threonine-protein kinase [Streptomyces cupreus]|uniref:Serine/threonine-protein kinase n=1 Tax=Streptomyces cupreus TaxID=2759956 RepID=A0A7X1JDA7_9ACTN|nr:serine/threonine-protein kinase [Streptomyces cupreus]MBC2908255.1 serine/threonine-protein kinase [Streptomyces cupreus]